MPLSNDTQRVCKDFCRNVTGILGPCKFHRGFRPWGEVCGFGALGRLGFRVLGFRILGLEALGPSLGFRV